MVDILRKGHVQALRAAAKKCKVPLIRDDVGRERVTELAGAIRDSTGPADQKQQGHHVENGHRLNLNLNCPHAGQYPDNCRLSFPF